MKTPAQAFLIALIIILLQFGISAKAQTFQKIINDPSVSTYTQSYGASMIDFDNDGDLDLFVANFTNSTNEFFLNNGNGTFTANSSYVFTSTVGSSLGHSWIDFDKDCDLDLFVSNGGINGSQFNRLFVNNNGTYALASAGIIPSTGNNSQTSNWGDYDNDGDLDLFICNMASQNNYFLINNNGVLTLNTTSIISTDGGTSNDANWVDYDNDGDLDLFVANNNNEKNFLYRNNGNGTFTKITSGAIVNDIATSLGCTWGDYDNDGDLDLYVCNAYSPNFMYNNNGNGTFTKITTGAPVTDNYYSYGATWVDYDNDGDLDLHVVNSNGQNNRLYTNNGNGTFTSVTSGSIVNDGGTSRSSTWGDIDRDGDLDCYITNRSYSKNFLYINQTAPQNHWLHIKLKGIISNYDAIGCVVKAKATINGTAVWQMRHISSKAGYCSQESPEVEFGFGSTTMVDSLVIYWPASNTTCVYTNITCNQFLTYYETCTNLNYYTLSDTICVGTDYTIKLNHSVNWYSDSLGTQLIKKDSIFQFYNLTQDTTIYFSDINYSCGPISSYHIVVQGAHFHLDLGNDTSLCAGDSLIILLPFPTSIIQWQDGSSDSLYVINQAGSYSVKVDSAGCVEKDTINVFYHPVPSQKSKEYFSICMGEEVSLSAESGFNYLWSNADTNQSILVGDSGLYYVDVYNQCDTVRNHFEVEVKDCNCMMAVPNVFTPNGDGLNDYFYPVISCIFDEYHIVIYNRWGQLLFESFDQDEKWDGRYKGNEVPEGVYFYLIRYKHLLTSDKERQRSGSITLFR